MTQYQILYRRSPENQEEFEIAKKYFDVKEYRTDCYKSLVIGRYSVLPFYRELEQDLAHNGCNLINSWKQHRWIANFDYYEVLKHYTPETWFDYNIHRAPDIPMVVKGRTNSRKLQWNKLMYAPNKRRALEIANELCNDPLIGPQGIIYRRYVPLETFGHGLNGLPFTNEWRFFYFANHCIKYGYYWDMAKEIFTPAIHTNVNSLENIEPRAINFADDIARIVSKYVNFFVLDVAKTLNGSWILIEINDGSMSGLSTINPEDFYKNLKKFCHET